MSLKADQRHEKAYALFVSLGPKRTLKKVAEQTGLSVSTIKAWAKHENWKGRLAEQESQQARQVIDRNLHDGAQETSRNIRLVQMALLALAKNIREGKVTGVMSDIDRLIRLEEYLTGKFAGTSENDIVVRLPADPAEREELAIRAIVELYRRRSPERRQRVRAALAEIDLESPPPSDKGVIEHATNPPATA